MSGDVGLVCFDLGRVLIRLCDSWRHAFDVAGIVMPPPRPYRDLDVERRLAQLKRQFDQGEIDLQSFAAQVGLCHGLGCDQVIQLNRAYLREPYPQTIALLEQLAEAGIRTACLSNTNADHWRMISEPGPHYLPLERLTYRFASHLIGLRKPDAAIYAHVEEQTGCAPETIVFFDDMPENIEAASRRRWRAHRVLMEEDPIDQVRRTLRGYGLI
jgi:glucose-1-phosphatase